MAVVDHCGVYRLLREPLDLRVSGGTFLGFPSMYRPPKLRVVQRGRLASVVGCGISTCWSVPLSLVLSLTFMGPPYLSRGFPLMYPASCSLASSTDLFCVWSARIFARSSSWSGTSVSFALSSSSALFDEHFCAQVSAPRRLRPASAGFPSMYRPPKLHVVQRGRLASSSCVLQPGQPVI